MQANKHQTQNQRSETATIRDSDAKADPVSLHYIQIDVQRLRQLMREPFRATNCRNIEKTLSRIATDISRAVGKDPRGYLENAAAPLSGFLRHCRSLLLPLCRPIESHATEWEGEVPGMAKSCREGLERLASEAGDPTYTMAAVKDLGGPRTWEIVFGHPGENRKVSRDESSRDQIADASPMPEQRPSPTPEQGALKVMKISNVLNPLEEQASGQISTKRSPTETSKTTHERAKGQGLNGEKGVPANQPCARCSGRQRECRVAKDPREFNSFKCGNCISGKNSCSFNYENPGHDYSLELMSAMQEGCRRKKTGREQARQTLRSNRARRQGQQSSSSGMTSATQSIRNPSEEGQGSSPPASANAAAPTSDSQSQQRGGRSLEPAGESTGAPSGTESSPVGARAQTVDASDEATGRARTDAAEDELQTIDPAAEPQARRTNGWTVVN
ncbi:hypothetical protein F5Y15DRAFT_414192 [Xylariaceae sp. FL0016]|nr:hypothetical protein F5Y15DRAFT_414192 [Xylariaceae sp. FL0016]